MRNKLVQLLVAAMAAMFLQATADDASAQVHSGTLQHASGSKMTWGMAFGTRARLILTNWSAVPLTGRITGGYTKFYAPTQETQLVFWSFETTAMPAIYISPQNMADAYLGIFHVTGYNLFSGVAVFQNGVIVAYKVPGESDTGVHDPCTWGTFYSSAGNFEVWGVDNNAPNPSWKP